MPTPTVEIRPENDLPADYVTGFTGAAQLRDGGRIERRHTSPNAGWYRIVPRLGAIGPFPTPEAARGRR